MEVLNSLQTIVNIISYNVAIFIALMFLDIVLGIIKATRNHSLASAIMTLGIRKKGAMMIAIIFAVFMDALFFKTSAPTAALVTLLVIANEGLSITENLAQLGIPIPSAITRRLHAMQDTLEQVESKVDESQDK